MKKLIFFFLFVLSFFSALAADTELFLVPVGDAEMNVGLVLGDEETNGFLYGVNPAIVSPIAGGGGAAAASGALIVECQTTSDCGPEKYCLNSQCLKIFDLKILNFDSPVQPGEFFDFDYFIKGMANISGDVNMQFWIEQNGEIITTGNDIIFVGNFEEKIDVVMEYEKELLNTIFIFNFLLRAMKSAAIV